MVKYEESIIYKLCCKDTDITEIYIGSTTNFGRRKNNHKSNCNNINNNLNVYKFIRDNGGFENWDMICVEQYEATDKRDLQKRERYWIETLESKLNIIIPYKSIEEIKEIRTRYRSENKDKINESNALYRSENREKINESQALYCSKNKDKIKETNARYYSKKKEEIKEREALYRSENEEKIKEYKAQYRSKNRNKINELKAHKVICECGSEVRKCYLSKHKESKKHIKYSETLNQSLR